MRLYIFKYSTTSELKDQRNQRKMANRLRGRKRNATLVKCHNSTTSKRTLPSRTYREKAVEINIGAWTHKIEQTPNFWFCLFCCRVGLAILQNREAYCFLTPMTTLLSHAEMKA